jgi:LPXTG-motif cell wall-anchored protein
VPPPPTTAATGGEISEPVTIGFGLVIIGALAVASARRRKGRA